MPATHRPGPAFPPSSRHLNPGNISPSNHAENSARACRLRHSSLTGLSVSAVQAPARMVRAAVRNSMADRAINSHSTL